MNARKEISAIEHQSLHEPNAWCSLTRTYPLADACRQVFDAAAQAGFTAAEFETYLQGLQLDESHMQAYLGVWRRQEAKVQEETRSPKLFGA